MIFLYLFEIISFVSTIALIWCGLFWNIDIWRFVICMTGSLVSLCVLLLFHVREYGRVETIVREVVAQLLRENFIVEEQSLDNSQTISDENE